MEIWKKNIQKLLVLFFYQELIAGRIQMRHLANQWYSEVRGTKSETEEELETSLMTAAMAK